MSTAAPPARILIADDQPLGAELLEAYLAHTAFDIRVSSNGEETLQIIQSWLPDVVLLDVMMPKLSGFEVCKQLRADEATRSIGVLMVTALDQGSDVDRAVDAGTDDFITKPIHKTELLIRIQALLAARKETNDLDRAFTYLHQVESMVALAEPAR